MSVVAAARLLFIAVFVWTGVSKLVAGPRVELALVKLLGMRFFDVVHLDSRVAVRLLAGYELGLAAALALGVPGLSWVVVATMAVFVVVVVRAWRLHVDCGCFPDRRPSEVGSVVRTGSLLVISVVAAVVDARSDQAAPTDWMLATLVALALAALVSLLHWTTATLARRGSVVRATPHPTVVHAVIANQIADELGARPLPVDVADEEGWVEAGRAAALMGLPVSVLMAELAGGRQPGFELLPLGSRPEFSVPTTRGDRPNGVPLLVGLFSSACDRCPTHIGAVRTALTRVDRPEALMIIAGPAEPADRFVQAFADRAAVALVAFEDPVIDTFRITEFPAYYLLDDRGTVISAALEIDDLALPAP